MITGQIEKVQKRKPNKQGNNLKTVKIKDHKIGIGNAPFFVAELGICHEGRLDIALELTKAAIDAGAHCIKTETFQRETIVFDSSATMTFCIDGKQHTTSLSEHMDKYELSFEEHHQIKKYCDEKDVPFISTAHDFKAVDFLINIGVAAIKVASPDIVHFPLLRYIAQKRIPVFLDTGSAYQYEIELAVKQLRDSGHNDIIINHNPQGHPAPANKHDLRIIPRLKEIINVPIGLADHYEDYEMLYAATAIGANTLEKPISRDRFVCEPERNWSINIDDLPQVLKKIENVYYALGNHQRTLIKTSEKYRSQNRVACVAAKDLKAGDIINFDNVIFGRPRKGIGVEHWDLISGRVIKKIKKKHDFIQWEDL
ncbi:N-acetylneuraminate synthase [Candidatus Magnetomorum sp. HK-1]|nr:N-acetylneuraminate synthase [Candidatus Magnetomorum sp. HK-1]